MNPKNIFMSKNFKIGVENFRVFKEMTEFELRPLTILVGPNNSGKSSFTKLLLLLKNGFNPLNFKKGDHHLGSYEKSLNWDPERDEMVLKNEAAYFLSPDQFTEEIRYNDSGGVKEQTITNNKTGQNLLKSKFLDQGILTVLPQTEHFSLDIKYIIDLLYDKEILVNCSFVNETADHIIINPVPLKKLKKLSENENIPIMQTREYFYENQYFNNHKKPRYGSLETDLIRNSILMNEINRLENDYLLCKVFVNGKEITDKDKILKFQNKIFYNREIDYTDNQPLQSIMRSIFDSLKNSLKHEFEKEYKEYTFKNDDELNVEVKATTLGRLIFTENLFEDQSEFFPRYLSISLFQHFISLMFTELNQLKELEYIPVNRGNQSRVLLAESNEATYKGVTEYHNFKNSKNIKILPIHEVLSDFTNPDEMLKVILEKIGIIGKITTEHFEDTVSIVYIENNGKKINLADFGFGYSQLIPIILKVYNLSFQYNFKSILIIEEPEANLHPNLQAKLADILAIVIKHNKGWKIVVETHSEYLIRKLQYLVAKQEIERKDCIIHYFNADENVSKEEPKVKPIEINEEGNLTDNFGPGFFDEATRLQFDLLKLNKPQSN